ncbi:MAG: hypothetical protein HC905_10595 [Bacteroidales bacterium]|nr:hypothetical protein [Bacteroidales bacterium]
MMAFVFEGFIQVPATGVYTFKLISDDGSQLLINNRMIINHDGPHGPEPREGQAALEKGLHAIKVKYFEAGGGETLQLLIRSENMPEQEVSPEMLFLQKNKFHCNDKLKTHTYRNIANDVQHCSIRPGGI